MVREMALDKAKAPVADIKALGQALLRIGSEVPLPLPPGCELRVVTAAQSALLDFFAQHPYCTIETLDVHAGDPDLMELRLNEVAVKKIKLAGRT